jgi:hypothetical protein
LTVRAFVDFLRSTFAMPAFNSRRGALSGT